mmetsp:Transcript_14861/g.34916  ORF Transcript_14861/g.34916 Transcript_14861/m.34916 type:complete len:318 (+) Transcript_14861:826-1779(+)
MLRLQGVLPQGRHSLLRRQARRHRMEGPRRCRASRWRHKVHRGPKDVHARSPHRGRRRSLHPQPHHPRRQEACPAPLLQARQPQVLQGPHQDHLCPQEAAQAPPASSCAASPRTASPPPSSPPSSSSSPTPSSSPCPQTQAPPPCAKTQASRPQTQATPRRAQAQEDCGAQEGAVRSQHQGAADARPVVPARQRLALLGSVRRQVGDGRDSASRGQDGQHRWWRVPRQAFPLQLCRPAVPRPHPHLLQRPPLPPPPTRLARLQSRRPHGAPYLSLCLQRQHNDLHGRHEGDSLYQPYFQVQARAHPWLLQPGSLPSL